MSAPAAGRLGRAEDDAERLPPPELDQHGLAVLRGPRGEAGTTYVYGRAAAGAGSVDRDLDEPRAGVGIRAEAPGASRSGSSPRVTPA